MNIRPALDIDAGRIAALFVQLGYAVTVDALQQRLLRHPDTEVLVATEHDVVQAVLVMNILHPLHVARPWAVISAFVVDEARRSHGAGAALLKAAHWAAAKRGCAHVELSCSERRTRAHEFYEEMGYEEVRKHYLKTLAGHRHAPDKA